MPGDIQIVELSCYTDAYTQLNQSLTTHPQHCVRMHSDQTCELLFFCCMFKRAAAQGAVQTPGICIIATHLLIPPLITSDRIGPVTFGLCLWPFGGVLVLECVSEVLLRSCWAWFSWWSKLMLMTHTHLQRIEASSSKIKALVALTLAAKLFCQPDVVHGLLVHTRVFLVCLFRSSEI